MEIQLNTAVESKGKFYNHLFYNVMVNPSLSDSGTLESKISVDTTPFKNSSNGVEICPEKRTVFDFSKAAPENISAFELEIHAAIKKFLNAEINK